MDSKTDSTGLAELREMRDAISLATSAGLSVIDIVALVPSLGPQAPVSTPTEPEPTGSCSEDEVKRRQHHCRSRSSRCSRA
ncbi:hypothetical protein ABZ532_31610 [Streptomyces sp. NPDC019396]|uniref:hypothetical protein n=1 Tax=Streptomyces sp. NPDC019396 TaxID=3154687 RepID=UPI0033DD709A